MLFLPLNLLNQFWDKAIIWIVFINYQVEGGVNASNVNV